ncbi:4-hydroxybenzoate 3-monooxygenase [Roseovarius sp. ZX-A-9]|uniref:4-hydroxybenzoate 3-monooxygenase n=1 Tax=Roseovarius sp. ZX-A-9 TaxID=3014783 RepID=UPI00232BD62B|nr:4-hydroxybenzoate 3-monooxygenase [Roseovarius sp. ZX-A-9]
MRCQVAIIGGGPAGLLLGQLLHRAGIDTVLLERRSRDHVLSRVRAGVLETGMVYLLEAAGVGARLRAEGLIHDSVRIVSDSTDVKIDFKALTGRHVVIYGQTEVTHDLYAARDAAGAVTLHDCDAVTPCDIDTDAPYVSFTHDGQAQRLDCDLIAGCDGFHGPSRHAIPAEHRTEFEKTYPFGWLGILSQTRPVGPELIYANTARGFALCSQRSPELSRYYVQCALSDSPDDWTDAMFWDELRRRLPAHVAETLITGPSIEKSIAPLRSFVCVPMQWGRLYLCGDAAHIVPPTGAKGLNTAASDVAYLFDAVHKYYDAGDETGLADYSTRALARVWKVQRFSWWLTNLLHRFPDQSRFDIEVQQAELAFLSESHAAQTALAENYVGLPH